MKKVLSFVAIAAITVFVASCGNDDAKRKEDSTRNADSLQKVADAQKHIQDSTNMADSMKRAADAAMQQHIADSLRMDSMAKAGNKAPKPKTVEQKQKEENKKATGGKGH